MTPLAHRVVKELTLPKRARTFDDDCGLLSKMDSVHCFETSSILEFCKDMELRYRNFGIDSRTMFLPAPKTWIEFDISGFGRTGILLIETSDKHAAHIFLVSDARVNAQGVIHLRDRAEQPASLVRIDGEQNSMADDGLRRMIAAMLACINTPRIIGRRQHMPHRGLEKRLTAALGPQGRFPLHAWTEILLHVTPPKDASGEPSTEAHLTGERALHFCRAHLRVRLGRLEIVRAHWRGDASLGIKQSRYRVAA